MKKLLILISSLFLLTSCGDYKEVNNLAIVNSIGIDYYNNNYEVTLEILNSKVEKESGQVNSYTVTGKSKYIANALENAANKLNLRPYYPHLKLALISEEIAKNHLDNITDYFVRNNYFRENYYLVICKNNMVQKLLSNKTKEIPIPGKAIINLLNNNSYASNYAINKNFLTFLQETLDYGIDSTISFIDIKDDNYFINGMGIFKDEHLVNILDNNEALMYNLINNKIDKPLFTLKIDNKPLSFVIYSTNIKKSIDDSININGNLLAKIVDNNLNIDMSDELEINKLNHKLTKYINNKINNSIRNSQLSNSDYYGLSKIYYQQSRIKNKELWKKLEVNSNVKVTINKKGLIYKKNEND